MFSSNYCTWFDLLACLFQVPHPLRLLSPSVSHSSEPRPATANHPPADLLPPVKTMATKASTTAGEEPALGIPYNPTEVQGRYYYAPDPYAAGMPPSNAIYAGVPKGVPLQQTMFRDTPAPFHCQSCGEAAVSSVRSKLSLASVVACMMPFMMGVCFLCPSMDCLWHKYHYCPSCGEKAAEFKKDDPCLVVDPTRWTEPSFAVPA